MLPPTQSDQVWYAAYGSNLSAARFACYLAGGRPKGANRTYVGARDRTPPRDNRPLTLPHQLYFADQSTVWGGAPAFVNPTPDPHAGTLARAYLITWSQFEDVVAQENGIATPLLTISPSDLVPGTSHLVGPGRYANLLCVATLAGTPVLTLTAPWRLSDVEPAAPSLAYLTTIVAGLRETYALTDTELRDYLLAAPACTPELVDVALNPRLLPHAP